MKLSKRRRSIEVIPRRWNQVSIERYNQLVKTIDEKQKLPVDVTTLTEAQIYAIQIADLELMIKRCLILTDLEYEQAEALATRELMKVNELIAKPIKNKLTRFFKLDGQLYEICLNPTKENARRYMNVMNACKEDGVTNMHRIMFAISKPINNVFRKKEVKIAPENIDAVVESFRQVPISIAKPVVVFFCNLSIRLTKDSLEFSNRQMKKIQELLKAEADSLNATVGR